MKDKMSKAEFAIIDPDLWNARAGAAGYLAHFVNYANKYLNTRSVEEGYHDVRASFMDSILSNLVSFYPSWFLRDKLLEEEVLSDTEIITMSNVHFNFPVPDARIWMSFDAYSLVYDTEKKEVTKVIFWEIGTHVSNYEKKFVDYGLRRIQFIQRGFEQAGDESLSFIFVIITPHSDFLEKAMREYARETGITIVLIDYNKLKPAAVNLAVDIITSSKRWDYAEAWKKFIDEFRAANDGLELSDIVIVLKPE